jgi:hypothetical protein
LVGKTSNISEARTSTSPENLTAEPEPVPEQKCWYVVGCWFRSTPDASQSNQKFAVGGDGGPYPYPSVEPDHILTRTQNRLRFVM